jgi:zinc and cadmium transporter
VATTIAVVLHEIPQEIGDFGILIHAGFSRAMALLFNLISGLMAIAGVFLAYGLGQTIDDFSHLVLAFTAGSFIYIAGSDLIPELHENPKTKTAFIELFMILVGMAIMFVLTFLE